MRLLISTVLFCAIASCQTASGQNLRIDRAAPRGAVGHHVSPAVPPPAAAPQPPAQPEDDRNHASGEGHRRGRGRWQPNCPWYPGLGFPSAFVPILPPMNVWGYDYTLPTPLIEAPVVANPPAPRAAADDPPPRKVQGTSAEQKARAGRFVSYGDAQFEKQKYLAAVGRYKTAITTAPDLAESYFRQGFARVALGQYEQAAQAFRRGLAVRSDWRGSPFRLKTLYGNQPIAKDAHIENLARAVEQNPFDADLLLVLGVQLFFDGQADRAAVFLTRAAQLGGNEGGLLNDFLAPKPAGAVDAQPVAGKVVF